MKSFFRCATLAVLTSVVFMSGCSKSTDQVINVSKDDPEMEAAIAKARETLPAFWQTFDRHDRGETNFSLKVRISDPKGVEHFWMSDIARQDGKIMGTVGNDAEIVRSVKLGDRIQIPEADISDWLYFREDKMIGNYTLRVLFKQMPAKQVAEFKKHMADE